MSASPITLESDVCREWQNKSFKVHSTYGVEASTNLKMVCGCHHSKYWSPNLSIFHFSIRSIFQFSILSIFHSQNVVVFQSPVSTPFLSQYMRCSDVPWVNVSGHE